MLHLRPATAADVPVIFAMVVASSAEQGFPDEVAITEQNLVEDGFGAIRRFEVLMADWNGTPAGMALYFFNYSTWGSRLGLYLEDLYVDPMHRRFGIATALVRRLAGIALSAGCRRMQWVVHKENQPAVRTYGALGAKALEDWTLMSLKGANLEDAAD